MIKSVYKLDKRIKDVSDIQSPVRYDDSFIGEVCYFADSIWEFEDLESCNKGTLSEYIEDGYCQLGNFTANEFESDDYYGYFIPEKLLKPVEKKYRPYMVMEFIKEYPLGSHLHFRLKDDTMEMYRLIDGYNDCKNGAGTLFMCGAMYSMQELYDNYEIFEDGEWKPFGVGVEE